MSKTDESGQQLYSILKSKIDILSNWAKSNIEYKNIVDILFYMFGKLKPTDDNAIKNLYQGVIEFITTIPPEILPNELTDNAKQYDGGRRRKSASSSRPRRRSSKKRGTQRKQKRRQRRGSRRTY